MNDVRRGLDTVGCEIEERKRILDVDGDSNRSSSIIGAVIEDFLFLQTEES
jgi:hypothetical protein